MKSMRPPEIYDIAVIGAGPAGSMFARIWPDKSKTMAIIDARPLHRPYKPGDPVKSCGGLLAPDSQKFLKKYGITLDSTVFTDPKKTHVKTTDFKTGLTRHYRRRYLNMDREAFDRFLLKGIKADTYFETRVKKMAHTDGIYTIETDKGTLRCRGLVGADGAGSKVRQTFFKTARFKTYMSLQEYYKGGASQYNCYFDPRLTDYYGWSLSKNGCYQIGIALPAGSKACRLFDDFKKKAGVQGTPFKKDGAAIIRPGFFHPVSATRSAFLIGEAGGYISPSSAEGISFAFKTAEILAHSGLNEKSFRRTMRKIQLSIFIKNIKKTFIYIPFIRYIVMKMSWF
jgi:flavin-dependent dehydrogenase